eukprot:631609-Hanusia_phi.AAC.1
MQGAGRMRAVETRPEEEEEECGGKDREQGGRRERSGGGGGGGGTGAEAEIVLQSHTCNVFCKKLGLKKPNL